MGSTVLGQELRVVDLPVPGLDDERIRALAMDPKGALWLGTDRGLLRFDGGALERYESDPADPRSIPSDAMYDVLATADGWVWAATPKGIFRVNALTGERDRMPTVRDDGSSIPIECLSLSPSSTGLWAFMGRGGLYHLANGDTAFRAAKHPQGDPRRPVGGWEAPDGHLWYADRNAVRQRDPNTGQERIYHCAPLGQDPNKVLLLDLVPDQYDPNTLWCTSWGLGLLRFNIPTGTFTAHYLHLPLDGLRNIVRDVVQLGPGSWLVSMDDTLRLFDGQRITTAPQAPVSLGLLVDRGKAYIGSIGKLLLAAPPAAGVEVLSGLDPKGSIHAAGTLEDDGYWAVRFYTDRKLMRTDKKGRVREEIRFPTRSTMFEPFKLMVSQHGPARGHVWVGATKGLWLHVPGSGTLQEVPLTPDGGEEDPYPYILDQAEDARGRLWLITSTHGLLRHDPTDHRTVVVPMPEDATMADLISITQLDSGHMLATRRMGAPVVIDVNDLVTLTLQLTDRQQMGDVEGAIAIPSGDLIVYTRSMGIWRLERGASGTAWRTRRRWYLPDRPVLQDATCDGQGRVWLSSDRGAFLLDARSDLLHPLNELIGVPSRMTGELATTTNGDVVLTGNGVVRCPGSFEPFTAPRNLLLRSVRANDKDLTEAFSQGVAVELPFHQNRLTITYGCVALLDGNTITYAYRLIRNGTAQPWTPMDDQRRTDLIGLAPGDYTFQLRAEGPSFLPVFTEAVFSVATPWWASWWARLGLVVLGVAMVSLLTRKVLAARYLRKLQVVEKEREVERVRMRISRDIHDGIGSGLTRIMLMTRKLGGDPQQAQRISQASTELVQELGEIVWTVDPRNDSYGSFIAYIRSMLAKQFEHLDIQLILDLHCAAAHRDRIIGPELKRNVLLTMKEAVNNALKHSGANIIEVSLDLQHDRLALRVKDNGRGFDPTTVREGANGLMNFLKRAEAVHGEVQVNSGASGTEVLFTAPAPSTNM